MIFFTFNNHNFSRDCMVSTHVRRHLLIGSRTQSIQIIWTPVKWQPRSVPPPPRWRHQHRPWRQMRRPLHAIVVRTFRIKKCKNSKQTCLKVTQRKAKRSDWTRPSPSAALAMSVRSVALKDSSHHTRNHWNVSWRERKRLVFWKKKISFKSYWSNQKNGRKIGREFGLVW